jgi:hypothetical protein
METTVRRPSFPVGIKGQSPAVLSIAIPVTFPAASNPNRTLAASAPEEEP